MLFGILESFIDNVVKDTVYPVIGSIVYCDLAVFGFGAEHSGIYIGENRIVHLDGSGNVEVDSPKRFMDRLDGWNTAMSIYISCDGDSPVGSRKAANRAKKMIGRQIDYTVVLDNCHQFTSGCISGNFGNSDNFLWMLKHTAKSEISADTWRVWETVDGEYV